MSIEKYHLALKLIEDSGLGDFEGSKPESLVAQAETSLDLTFPPSYRKFLLEMGCGNINSFEIYGLINDNFENSSIPDGIWLTLNERKLNGLNSDYVLIGEGGDGTFYALDTKQIGYDNESPVVRLSADWKQSEKVAKSFGHYFFDETQKALL